MILVVLIISLMILAAMAVMALGGLLYSHCNSQNIKGKPNDYKPRSWPGPKMEITYKVEEGKSKGGKNRYMSSKPSPPPSKFIKEIKL